jgi:hypothetical protein
VSIFPSYYLQVHIIKKIDLEKSVYELPGDRSYTVDRWITANVSSCIDFFYGDKLINTEVAIITIALGLLVY